MNFAVLLFGLLPIFSIIIIGAVLKRYVVRTDTQWEPIERLSFFVLIPCLIVKTLSTADLSNLDIMPIAVILLSSLMFIISLLGGFYLICVRNSESKVSSYTSLFQTSTRWNAFVAIALVASLFGEVAVAITAVGMIVLMPFINVVNIVIMTWLLTDEKVNFFAVLQKIASNPIIVGCIVGIMIQVSGLALWVPVLDTLSILGDASLGIVVLSVGAGLRWNEIGKMKLELVLSCILKLIVMPAFAMVLALGFGLEGVVFFVAIIIAAMPTAANGFVLARQMGGDAPLYANAATVQVLASFFTIPVWVEILNHFAGASL